MAFEINYDKVKVEINKIQELSRDLSAEIRKLNSILDSVNKDWSGPASSEFQKQLVMLINSLKKKQNAMDNGASQILAKVNMLKEEDERQAMLAARLASDESVSSYVGGGSDAWGGGGGFGGR